MKQTLLVAKLILAAAIIASAQKTPEAMLGAAMHQEEVQGDLKSAIAAYQKVVAAKGVSRKTAAEALVRMGQCYEKLGDAESRRAYERVVREYADQKEAVTMARAKLGVTEKTRRQTNTLVWTGSKVDDEGTLSSDGRYLSFTDWSTGDLALREIATGESRLLTHTGNPPKGEWTDYAEESAISRDGKKVAFSWWNNESKRYDLRVVNVSGEPNPRRIFDDPLNEWLEPRDWSPDGKSIAVLINRKDDTDQIGLVSVADGSLRVLRSGTWPGNTRIFFSPDGQYLGYDLPESQASQPRDLFVFDLNAGLEIPVAIRRGQDIMVGWSPDGKRLLFASDRSGAMSLWGQPFGGGKPQGAPVLLKPDIGSIEPLGVTLSGALYYAVRSGISNASSLRIGSFDFETGRISAAREVSQDYPESNFSPCWSRDGKYFAYISQRGSPYRIVSVIVIRSAETNTVVRELPNKLMSMTGWAPDGQSLVGIGYHDGRRGAHRIDAQTGAITPLVTDPAASGRRIQTAVWAPDGRSLYYVQTSAKGQESALIRRDVASGSEKAIIRRSSLGVIHFSPDGRFIATPSSDPERNLHTLLLFAADGSESREIMSVPVKPEEVESWHSGPMVWAPIWSPDGKSLLIRKRQSKKDPIHEHWLVSLAGGAPRKVEASIDKNTWLYPIQPSGRQILFMVVNSGEDRLGQVWALENFLPTVH